MSKHERRRSERRSGIVDDAYAAWRAGETKGCANCHGEGWVCENHTNQGWPSVCSCGAGAPCPKCNPASPPLSRALDALRTIIDATAAYDDGPFGFEGMPGDEVGVIHRAAQRGISGATIAKAEGAR